MITRENTNLLLEKWIQFYQKLILELEKSDCSTWDEINHYLDENDSYDGNDRTWSKYLDNNRNYKPFQLTAEIDSEGKVGNIHLGVISNDDAEAAFAKMK